MFAQVVRGQALGGGGIGHRARSHGDQGRRLRGGDRVCLVHRHRIGHRFFSWPSAPSDPGVASLPLNKARARLPGALSKRLTPVFMLTVALLPVSCSPLALVMRTAPVMVAKPEAGS
ncbi:unnamed protein product [Pararhodospirillum photometricum DSM 122]|uniref:Uncharacterized protein n=1 Tax=Pararhodospirillum photometricum DSM 122 TaxID=1150469 RepID=H6SR94_PARPM|nr:unnamed protein product [Pararhodospirillum photometricum DSM 122]